MEAVHESQQGGKGVRVEGVRVKDEIREVEEMKSLDVVLAQGLRERKHLLCLSQAPALNRRSHLGLD